MALQDDLLAHSFLKMGKEGAHFCLLNPVKQDAVDKMISMCYPILGVTSSIPD
jgi:hypothetical protein